MHPRPCFPAALRGPRQPPAASIAAGTDAPTTGGGDDSSNRGDLHHELIWQHHAWVMAANAGPLSAHRDPRGTAPGRKHNFGDLPGTRR
jgi:hypothetical protein